MDVIKVENLYKQYRLGQVSTGTISHDLNRWWYKVRGKEDPYEKITEVNNRTQKTSGEYVWALEDVNFSVEKGEVLGIIGKNGAGKSTLLKILSKVTGPTKGDIKVRGRIASLLEVGTGFHPELTGRENVFLNGAILGMQKSEITAKFDEIVAFSGVEKYIDTPVKRYSSGMYVRLAFAVAAHLEPEILIIDEVLAVGDAEFQKKCLGKMKDVSGQGRTVLFVSHNMTAVNALCNKAILLKHGKIISTGRTHDVVNEYIKINSDNIRQNIQFENKETALGNDLIKIKQVSVSPDEIDLEDDISVLFEFWNMLPNQQITLCFDLVNIREQTVFSTATSLFVSPNELFKAKCTIPGNFLNDDIYSITVYFIDEERRPVFSKSELVQFEVKETDRGYAYFGKVNGVVRPQLKWE
ncbi:MAG: ABC transporter ATP-binding protein [Bacteroidetes bacterium]|nr:ABC transporter ATP-binding protein [Bacteroidota bacterium]